MHIHRTGDVRALNVHTEIPGLGFLPVNAFVLHAEQPAVIGTGPSAADKDFASALYEVLDPTGVRSLCITHPDATNQQSSNRDPGTRRKSMSAVTTSVQSF
jgi:hypothetical protein